MDAYVYDGLRTPVGRHGGALAAVRPDDLAGDLIKTLVGRSAFDPASIEDVILGCTNQAGEDSRNVARRAALVAGLPIDVAGLTVNRLCASGLAAIADAARCCVAGQGSLFVAGGVESMSRAPYALAKATTPYARDQKLYDTVIGSRFPNPRQISVFGDHSMPETGDEVACDLGITREAADRFALWSQENYAAAKTSGFYKGEIAPVEVPARRRGETVAVAEDEHPRPETTFEKLAKLRPLLEGGVVTAGNASGINDGAAALLVGTRSAGETVGAKPLARIVTAAVAGVEPRIMGTGPVPASRKALERAGLSLSDMDVIEINEAFASQVLGCLKLLEIPFDDPRVNPNGGAIAIGHPLGASGARICLTAVRELQRRQGRYALVTMCIGVGQGMAMILERA
jgi:acetyl-CoA C-acetyltransferase